MHLFEDNIIKYYQLALPLIVIFILTSCAGRHQDCLDADAFGHCNHWKGQEPSCTERVFGICTNKGRQK